MPRAMLVPVTMIAAWCAGAAVAQGDTIYRCTDALGAVLYSNTPCPGGRTLALPDVKPDPAARERLQRDLDAFQKRQAVREAAQLRERELQSERNRAAAQTAQAEPQPDYVSPYYAYGTYYPYAVPPRPPLPRPRPTRSSSYVPVR
jgi:hypothetical protein